VKLLADEGVDARIVLRLRSEGHDVTYVAELAPGITDDDVLALAKRDGRVLITADKDFGELVFRLRRAASGVVLVRLAGSASDHKADLVAASLRDHGHEMLGAFTVVSPGVVRIRQGLDEG
jgi:predicted nuclease of predicted toxin-antitoxin system